MIISFQNAATEDIFNGHKTKSALKLLPVNLWTVAGRKLDMLDSAAVLEDLRSPPGNRLEQLKRNRKGQHSIRINDQYRICFIWADRGPEKVEVVDYHW